MQPRVPARGPFSSRNVDRHLSLLDQGITSVARFAAIVLFARALTPPAFDVVALAISVTYIAIGFSRAAFALPFAAFCSTSEKLEVDGAAWFAFGLVLVAISAAVPLAFAGIAFAFLPHWVFETAVYCALLCPLVLFYEFSRRWLFQWQALRSVLAQLVLFSALTAGGLAAFWFVFQLRWVQPSLSAERVVLPR